MDLSYSAEYEGFRQELRQFLVANWTDQDRAEHGADDVIVGRIARPGSRVTEFRLAAIEAGLFYRNVPRRWGGGEQPFDPLRSKIIREELKAVGAPREMVGQGPSMLVPTLLEHGTDEQKEKFVRSTLLGQTLWCQGYSEPGAGSDLASLRTKAELDGDHWVVNGQKIWTSNAEDADWMFCLVRTEVGKPRHDGISYLLIEMNSPGIDVRPLRQITGDADFSEVFFDNARVPATNIVGERGQGWIVSRSTLKHERALIGDTEINRRSMDGLVFIASTLERKGKPAIKDPVIRDRLIELESRLLAHEYHSMRLLTMQSKGQEAGLAGIVPKLAGTQLTYDMGKAAMDIMASGGSLAPGEDSAPAGGMFVTAYYWALGVLIAGGTANIQRNIIAERGLGMPRDPAQVRPSGPKAGG